MCGINGIYAYHYAANPINRAELACTRNHLAARGPDGMGEWIADDGRLGFGHRRLSIIDLTDAGAQPMASADGTLVITFNGEIYNYRELRRRLETKGHVFRSQSDTEVLLHLYAQKGEAMLHDLRGMFAFAIWDTAQRTLVLARDPLGIKPLYYSDDGWTFRFASQVKALLAGGAVSRDPETAGQVGFYLFGSVPEPFTTYRAIRALPAGAMLTVDRIGAREPRRFYSIAQAYCDAELEARNHPPMGEADAQAEIAAALMDSVRHHLVADVAVGAFLSAGIDSGALVGLMRDASQQEIQTVTLAFREFRGCPEDEAPLAEEVAGVYGTRHTTRVVTEGEFIADLPRIIEAMDQPSIDGINTWFVSKASHELGLKVAISGLGGDELFGGYPSFRDIPRWVGVLALPTRLPLLGKGLRRSFEPLVRALGGNPKLAGLPELGGTYAGAYLLRRGLFMSWELGVMPDPDVAHEGLRRLEPLRLVANALAPCPQSAHARVATLEASLYMRNQLLRDTDWASMAHSLEVRVPLADATLLRRIAPMIIGRAPLRAAGAKASLAQSPSRPLPTAAVAKAKTGFTTPIARWLQAGGLPNLWAAAPRKVPLSAHWSRQWAECMALA